MRNSGGNDDAGGGGGGRGGGGGGAAGGGALGAKAEDLGSTASSSKAGNTGAIGNMGGKLKSAMDGAGLVTTWGTKLAAGCSGGQFSAS